MNLKVNGIHHITAVASDPQGNLDFYTRVLGLRLVKKTVNFDDPTTYHLYFGDKTGSPGTILTFFPWVGARRGRIGMGQVGMTAFAVPGGALDYWEKYLGKQGVSTGSRFSRYNETVLPFIDPDGLWLELVADPGVDHLPAWEGSPIPQEFSIRGFHAATLVSSNPEGTTRMLDLLGFVPIAEDKERRRYQALETGFGMLVDLLNPSQMPAGSGGAGTIHHIAWRTPDDATQLTWQQRLIDQGVYVTPVRDRQYFHSIYFREPGGILFEIATDPPGFLLDENVAELGSSLMLPPWLQEQKMEIEKSLPPLGRVANQASPSR